MKINIQSLHFKATETLESYVSQKVEKLSHFHPAITSGNVCLKLENSETGDNKVCEIRIHIPGRDLFAKRQRKTFEEATTEALDALQDQLRKNKD